MASPFVVATPMTKSEALLYHIFQLFFGFLAICLSGYLLSHSTISITTELGLSDVLFGVIILAIATTPPPKTILASTPCDGEEICEVEAARLGGNTARNRALRVVAGGVDKADERGELGLSSPKKLKRSVQIWKRFEQDFNGRGDLYKLAEIFLRSERGKQYIDCYLARPDKGREAIRIAQQYIDSELGGNVLSQGNSVSTVSSKVQMKKPRDLQKPLPLLPVRAAGAGSHKAHLSGEKKGKATVTSPERSFSTLDSTRPQYLGEDHFKAALEVYDTMANVEPVLGQEYQDDLGPALNVPVSRGRVTTPKLRGHTTDGISNTPVDDSPVEFVSKKPAPSPINKGVETSKRDMIWIRMRAIMMVLQMPLGFLYLIVQPLVKIATGGRVKDDEEDGE